MGQAGWARPASSRKQFGTRSALDADPKSLHELSGRLFRLGNGVNVKNSVCVFGLRQKRRRAAESLHELCGLCPPPPSPTSRSPASPGMDPGGPSNPRCCSAGSLRQRSPPPTPRPSNLQPLDFWLVRLVSFTPEPAQE